MLWTANSQTGCLKAADLGTRVPHVVGCWAVCVWGGPRTQDRHVVWLSQGRVPAPKSRDSHLLPRALHPGVRSLGHPGAHCLSPTLAERPGRVPCWQHRVVLQKGPTGAGTPLQAGQPCTQGRQKPLSRLTAPVPQTECLGPPHNDHVEALTPQREGIWRWGPHDGVKPYYYCRCLGKKRHQSSLALSPPPPHGDKEGRWLSPCEPGRGL